MVNIVCCCSVNQVQRFATPWTAAHQSSPSFTIFWNLAQTHVRGVSDVIQPSHPLSSPFPPAFYLSQHHGQRQTQLPLGYASSNLGINVVAFSLLRMPVLHCVRAY